MYTEIDVINEIQDKPTKVKLLVLFIEEYAGWLQHLNTVGLKWGSNAEEVGANKEAVKTRQHIEALKNELFELTN